MSNVNVVVAGPEQWDVVERFVVALLAELGNEGDELGSIGSHVRSLWETQPGRMRAVIAYGDGGEPLGLLTLVEGFAIYANGLYGIIAEMYVVPHARSSGVGRRLIECAAEVGNKRGWSRIDVTAPESPAWERSVRFYESCGFRFAGPKLKKTL
jgi:GNAT superfamily N-acetyltransferase